MKQEKIEIIYQLIINDLVLTHNLLLQKGITEEDIEELVNTRYLMIAPNNKYSLGSIEKFRQYGISLLLKQKTKEANSCFRKCYELAPRCKEFCLQVLLAAIKRYDYQEAFKIYAQLETIQPDKNRQNNNLYLYLMSVITECPAEYQDKLIDLEYQDLILPKAVCNKIENCIRKAIAQSKYTYAYQLINKYIPNDTYSVKFELIKALLVQAINCEKEHKANLLYLAKTEQYSEIIKILNKRQQIRPLSNLETYVILITDAIYKLLETKEIPVPANNNATDIFEALIDNNYQLALELEEHHIEYVQADKQNDIVYILLVKLNNLIFETQNNQFEEQTIENKETNDINIDINTDTQDKDNSYSKEIEEIELLAYYLKEEKISLEQAVKSFGILKEQIQLIKLIYARDCYIEKNYALGDQYIQEVEQSKISNAVIYTFLLEVKSNKEEYAKKHYTKKKI